MTLKRTFYFLLFTVFSSSMSYASESRDLLINKQLDCVDHLQHSGSITWNDVCEITQEDPQDRAEIINQQMDQAENPPKHARNPEITYGFAPEISYIRYREPGLRVKEQGNMFGINTSYTYRPKPGSPLNSEISDVYRAEGRFSYGKVKYIGSLGDGTPFTFSGIDDFMVELRGLIGKDYTLQKLSTRLTPYWGLGYRSLFDSLRESGPSGYDRWIQYFYLPTGLEGITQLNNGWALGANAEYDFLLHGNVSSYLSQAGLGDVQNAQRHGYGVKGSFKIIKKLAKVNLILEPYIRFWHIRNSETQPSKPFLFNGKYYVVYGLEPNNNSTEIGARLGIEF